MPKTRVAPTAPVVLTRTQKILVGTVVVAVLTIATLGFIGSYAAVTKLAERKGFGAFADAFPIAVDAGIIAFLALDLLLTWRRIPYPLLRHTAWGLTAATIAFNAVAAWPDPVGVGMHGVIPVLFVIAVEAARHAVGRIADITADKFIESPPLSRWFLNPLGTFVIWRRMRLWNIRSYETVIDLELQARIYRAQLRQKYGRRWRRKASAEQLLVLDLVADGMSVSEAIDRPALEEEKRRQEADRIARERQEAEDERRRKDLAYKAEQQRLEDEQRRQIEADRLEQERQALELEKVREDRERQRRIDDAEARVRLTEIARREQQAQEEVERQRRLEELEHARCVAEEQQKAAGAALVRQEAEEAARVAAVEKEAATRRAAEVMQRAASASASRPPANANSAAASRGASGHTETASGAVPGPAATTASAASANRPGAGANEGQSSATTSGASSGGSSIDVLQVVSVYQLLTEQHGKQPSDAQLGTALGVSRSRAQQLRTDAIQAGHTQLAKPVRLAS
ncbi:DUF2637 domain-containing protein [Streptomyces sp. NPDC047315]|uniref:DUF2637 domain-containing protein n=1 Tax=Streptomyces sp. NPDC047315 TaxID=3155142 RepID=UPI0033F4EF6A